MNLMFILVRYFIKWCFYFCFLGIGYGVGDEVEFYFGYGGVG